MTVKINDKPWRELVNLVHKASGKRVQVGVFDGQVAEIAKYHEFGAPNANIPERSFIRRTLTERRDELAQIQQRIAKLLLERKIDETKAMQILGAWLAAAVKQTVVDQPKDWAPLQPRTIARKGPKKNKILINTGQLIASIVFRIVGR